MEYKQERYNLNKLCEFTNREVESAFMEYEKASGLGIIRILVLVMGFTFASFAVSDYYSHYDERTIIISLILRGIGLLTAVVAFFLAGKFSRHDHTLLMVIIAELFVFTIYLVNLYNQKTIVPSVQFMSVMLQILTAFLIPNRWKNSLIAASTIWTGYIIFCFFFEGPSEPPSLTQRGIYLGVCIVSCAIFIYGRESSERKHFAAMQLLEFMSITDRLTGIYNRGRFEQTLGAWIKNMRHDPFCLLLFDIDDFKKVNDRWGHNAGDEVLIKITETATANIRDDDIFARWGGEEFVILFSGMDIVKGTELAERIRKAVEETICGKAGTVTISIGVVQYRREEGIEDFVKRADDKMYEAKKAGKNRVVVES